MNCILDIAMYTRFHWDNDKGKERGMRTGMRVIGYTRVSTDEQAREGISLDNQKAKIAAYCQLNDLELVDIIEDAGKSGKDLNREGMQSLLGMVKTRQIDAVVVYKLDRLSRRVKDTLSVLELLEKKGIAFHSLSERVDTKSAMGRFFCNVMASLAQMERDQISERTRDALQHKIRNGERAGQIPYGWVVGDDGKTLIENPSEQEVISLVRELHDQGYSYRGICRELDKEGYEPIGKMWHASTIGSILRRAA